LLPSMVEAKNFSEYPHIYICVTFISVICIVPHVDCCEIVVCWIQVISVTYERVYVWVIIHPVYQIGFWRCGSRLRMLDRNKKTFCTGRVKSLEYSWILLVWVTPCCHGYHYCFVQQTKELSREHKICCSNDVVLDCYDCFGCITMMYWQHITVKIV
jgi:hypothetical protein